MHAPESDSVTEDRAESHDTVTRRGKRRNKKRD